MKSVLTCAAAERFTRKFAPYIGAVWERAFDDTACLQRADGEGIDDMCVVIGVRFGSGQRSTAMLFARRNWIGLCPHRSERRLAQ